MNGSLDSLTFNMIYPVGSIYMSVNSISPATLFGGTWEQLEDVFLLAAGSTYAAGDTGGESEVTLSIAQIPVHSHEYIISGFDAGSAWYGQNGVSAGATQMSGSSGGGEAHNNMPPYLSVYMWKRTA